MHHARNMQIHVLNPMNWIWQLIFFILLTWHECAIILVLWAPSSSLWYFMTHSLKTPLVLLKRLTLTGCHGNSDSVTFIYPSHKDCFTQSGVFSGKYLYCYTAMNNMQDFKQHLLKVNIVKYYFFKLVDGSTLIKCIAYSSSGFFQSFRCHGQQYDHSHPEPENLKGYIFSFVINKLIL